MPSSEPKLPPLDLRDEVKDYEAFEEKRDILFKKCPHSRTVIKDGWLRCECGSGWSGDIPTLMRLQKALQAK